VSIVTAGHFGREESAHTKKMTMSKIDSRDSMKLAGLGGMVFAFRLGSGALGSGGAI